MITQTCGMSLPVIADLGDGIFLASHPNGPCVCTVDTLMTMERAVTTGEHIPDERLRSRIVEAYVKWSWPVMNNTNVP